MRNADRPETLDQPLLTVHSLSKSFLFKGSRVRVLQDITFTVRQRECAAFIGPSGCGKSTLLEILAGITLPDAGAVLHQNANVTGRAGLMGYMPQDDLLLPWLTLCENALLPVRIARKDIRSARLRLRQLLPDFGLEGFDDYLPAQLSGGMKQRVALLRTVMTETDILLLDEPFANLDAITRLQLQEWLLNLKNRLSQTILLVTHDIDEAIRLADTIHVMNGSPSSLTFQVNVPPHLHGSLRDITSPQWLQLKNLLTQKLL